MTLERAPQRSAALGARIDELLASRTAATHRFFTLEAGRIAQLCHRLAERFHRGGRLISIGDSAAARSDARHIAVEFVHPVIVGKRALPALGLAADLDAVEAQVDLLCTSDDIIVAFGADARISHAVATARRHECLTLAFTEAVDAEWRFVPPVDDPFVSQELVETLYHVLWELVHVFFEHRGLLSGSDDDATSDGGAASFLYPFLANEEDDLDAVLADVAQSVLMKAQEISELRLSTVGVHAEHAENGERGTDRMGSAADQPRNRDALLGAAAMLRAAFDAGGTLLSFGNGGSATDAMDAVADYRSPPHGWPPRRALDLTDDPAILTALANDIGTDALFSRQIIAYAHAGDVVMAYSTSGNSRNIIQALGEARKRTLATVAFVGYDGGRILSDGLADHVIVSPSEHVPRIQEAQAAAHHILRELVELV